MLFLKSWKKKNFIYLESIIHQKYPVKLEWNKNIYRQVKAKKICL